MDLRGSSERLEQYQYTLKSIFMAEFGLSDDSIHFQTSYTVIRPLVFLNLSKCKSSLGFIRKIDEFQIFTVFKGGHF